MRMLGLWVLSNVLFAVLWVAYDPTLITYSNVTAALIVYCFLIKLLGSLLYQLHFYGRICFRRLCTCCYRVDAGSTGVKRAVCCCRPKAYFDVDDQWEMEHSDYSHQYPLPCGDATDPVLMRVAAGALWDPEAEAEAAVAAAGNGMGPRAVGETSMIVAGGVSPAGAAGSGPMSLVGYAPNGTPLWYGADGSGPFDATGAPINMLAVGFVLNEDGYLCTPDGLMVRDRLGRRLQSLAPLPPSVAGARTGAEATEGDDATVIELASVPGAAAVPVKKRGKAEPDGDDICSPTGTGTGSGSGGSTLSGSGTGSGDGSGSGSDARTITDSMFAGSDVGAGAGGHTGTNRSRNTGTGRAAGHAGPFSAGGSTPAAATVTASFTDGTGAASGSSSNGGSPSDGRRIGRQRSAPEQASRGGSSSDRGSNPSAGDEDEENDGSESDDSADFTASSASGSGSDDASGSGVDTVAHTVLSLHDSTFRPQAATSATTMSGSRYSASELQASAAGSEAAARGRATVQTATSRSQPQASASVRTPGTRSGIRRSRRHGDARTRITGITGISAPFTDDLTDSDSQSETGSASGSASRSASGSDSEHSSDYGSKSGSEPESGRQRSYRRQHGGGSDSGSDGSHDSASRPRRRASRRSRAGSASRGGGTTATAPSSMLSGTASGVTRPDSFVALNVRDSAPGRAVASRPQTAAQAASRAASTQGRSGTYGGADASELLSRSESSESESESEVQRAGPRRRASGNASRLSGAGHRSAITHTTFADTVQVFAITPLSSTASGSGTRTTDSGVISGTAYGSAVTGSAPTGTATASGTPRTAPSRAPGASAASSSTSLDTEARYAEAEAAAAAMRQRARAGGPGGGVLPIPMGSGQMCSAAPSTARSAASGGASGLQAPGGLQPVSVRTGSARGSGSGSGSGRSASGGPIVPPLPIFSPTSTVHPHGRSLSSESESNLDSQTADHQSQQPRPTSSRAQAAAAAAKASTAGRRGSIGQTPSARELAAAAAASGKRSSRRSSLGSVGSGRRGSDAEHHDDHHDGRASVLPGAASAVTAADRDPIRSHAAALAPPPRGRSVERQPHAPGSGAIRSSSAGAPAAASGSGSGSGTGMGGDHSARTRSGSLSPRSTNGNGNTFPATLAGYHRGAASAGMSAPTGGLAVAAGAAGTGSSSAYAGALRKPSDALAAEAPPPPAQLSGPRSSTAATAPHIQLGPGHHRDGLMGHDRHHDGLGEHASVAGLPAASVGSDGHTITVLTPSGSIADGSGVAAAFVALPWTHTFGGAAQDGGILLPHSTPGGLGGTFAHSAGPASAQLQRGGSDRVPFAPQAASSSSIGAGPATSAGAEPFESGLRRRPSMEPHRAQQVPPPLAAPAAGGAAAGLTAPPPFVRSNSFTGPHHVPAAPTSVPAAAVPGALVRSTPPSSAAQALPTAGLASQPALAPAMPAAAAQSLKPARPSFVPARTVSAPPDASAPAAGAGGIPALTRATAHSTASVSLSGSGSSVAPTPTSTVIDISALLAEAEVETGRVLSRQTLAAEAAAATTAPSVQQAGPR